MRPEGPLAGIQEPDKVRTIFDASIINTTTSGRIRTTRPAPRPCTTCSRPGSNLTQGPFTLFKSDVSKAHRRIKVQRKDWKYMIATIKDKFSVNMVGIYGVATGAAWLRSSPACPITSHLTFFGSWSLWMTSWRFWDRARRNQHPESSCSFSLSWDAQSRGTKTLHGGHQ